MKIELDNVTDGQVFPQAVILLRGTVKNLVGGETTPISIAVSNDDRVGRQSRSIVPDGKRTGRFKVLLQLRRGRNNIRLTHGSSSRNVTVTFDPNLAGGQILRLAYVVCSDSDGSFQAAPGDSCDTSTAVARISLAGQLIQCFFSESLALHGLPRKTVRFPLEERLGDEGGGGWLFPTCHVFRSGLKEAKARGMQARELWTMHARELLESDLATGEGGEEVKFVAIMAATR